MNSNRTDDGEVNVLNYFRFGGGGRDLAFLQCGMCLSAVLGLNLRVQYGH